MTTIREQVHQDPALIRKITLIQVNFNRFVLCIRTRRLLFLLSGAILINLLLLLVANTGDVVSSDSVAGFMVRHFRVFVLVAASWLPKVVGHFLSDSVANLLARCSTQD